MAPKSGMGNGHHLHQAFGRSRVYLTAIIDLYSRKVLSWRLSNTLDTEFCISAFEEAIMTYGIPAIFNTDQGCHFPQKHLQISSRVIE